MPLTSSLRLAVAAKHTSVLDLGTATAPVSADYSVSLADGVAAGQANRLFADTRTLAASSTEDLDLAGILTDAFGAAITFARIKAMVIKAAAANTNNVLVGGASATQFLSWVGAATHTVTLRPGATLALIAGDADATGYVVGAGTADLLKIANSAGVTPVSYDVVLIGTSA
jgi:hypothetical protein